MTRKNVFTETKYTGVWQDSDTVPDGVVEELVAKCNGECILSFKYQGGTMMGHSSWYDSEGKYHSNDENYCSYYASCSTCDKAWKVERQ